PLFKMGEKAHNFTTHIWNRLHGVDVVIQPNLTVEDPDLRRIFRDFRFRRALSIAINRDEINTIAYFGKATPRQTTVIPSSMFYEETFATTYIEYDPDTARNLLTELGLVDRDGDALREYPDGEPFSITLEWVDLETPKGIVMELVSEYWLEVGIDLNLKQVSNSLQGSRARANLMQMTIWHADRTSDILFPSQPFWFVPMHIGWEECHWTPWSNWYLTGGEKGEEPPEDAKQLILWWEEMGTTMDILRRIELGKNILRSQAENLWTIGTLGLAPQPVVVSNTLRNVPHFGYWGWDNRWTLPYHPETWFLETNQSDIRNSKSEIP
ncbi:MAG: ABC transporter substrate-binding protein, partial [Candidatus Latescibacteria bacterium]|nr:ABC transporter substrate-binding protein [Candidatus Latescibacterota bacterium]